MALLSLRMSDPLASKLDALARKRGTSKAEIVRAALEYYLNDGSQARRLSCHDLAKDLCGSLEGPPDLSTNPRYMEGYGE